MRKYFIRKKEGKIILKSFLKNFSLKFFKSNPRIEVMELKANEKIIFIDGKPLIIQINEKLYPSLIFKEALDKLPKVIVDMGAIPSICNGSDVMIPGIKKIEGSFEPEYIVLIIDEKYSKPIAIGEAKISSKSLIEFKYGKAIKNVHYVGDKFWKIIS